MALAVTVTKKDVKGSEQYRAGTLHLGAYATAGFTLTAAMFGLNRLHRVRVDEFGNDGTTHRYFRTHPTTRVITAYTAAAPPVEVANTTDISTTVLAFEAHGR